ncbi:MAG: M6 family metalloprotease domain-containing protein, partial [Actinomycetota bacterium]|nr:M6 family metalloprotease domain-containing protein [Actinomycetota bacterium]
MPAPRARVRPSRSRPRLLSAVVVGSTMMLLGLAAAPAASQSTTTDPLAPVDAQAWVDQGELTWDDYTPVPGQDPRWRSGVIKGSRDQYTGAVVLLDFQDQPFLITQDGDAPKEQKHPFDNPQPGWDPIPRDQVDEWMDEYLNTPNEYNGFQSITGYWMEDTHGKSSVDLTTYGPYRLPGKVHEYGLADFAPVRGSNSQCPLGDVCDRNIRADGLALWTADVGNPKIAAQFNNVFFVTGGHDESSTWQEFGEMMFQTKEDVPASFGPPGAGGASPPLNNNNEPMENYSPTRYVPWTSWRAAASHWPNAIGPTTTQAESSGQSVYAHEFSHVRGLPDNYNNPFANNIRNYTGYWEMMSRGTFNGPGGTHNRWQVPNAGGSGLGPHHMVEFKQALDIYDPGDLVQLPREQLPQQGIAVATLQARSSVPGGDPVGLEVTFPSGSYVAGECQDDYTTAADRNFWCPPGTNWTDFSMEVVDRVGNDSFTPGHGVLLAQSRSSGTPRVWMIDSNPQDIGMIDFYRPDGTPVPVVRGDPRQLNDATFHAGTNSASEFEYVDKFNRLHFYILEKRRDVNGILHYDVAVRHLDGAGTFVRGLALGQASTSSVNPTTVRVDVPLTNTGQAGDGRFASDIYRIDATVEGEGWTVQLPHEVRAARAGETISVQALATSAEGAAESATVTLTATSEADPSKTQTVTVGVSRQTQGPQ